MPSVAYAYTPSTARRWAQMISEGHVIRDIAANYNLDEATVRHAARKYKDTVPKKEWSVDKKNLVVSLARRGYLPSIIASYIGSRTQDVVDFVQEVQTQGVVVHA